MPRLANRRETLTRQAHVKNSSALPRGSSEVAWAVLLLSASFFRLVVRWAWWFRSEIAPLVVSGAIVSVLAGLLGGIAFLPHQLALVASILGGLAVLSFLLRRLAARWPSIKDRRAREQFLFGFKRSWPVVMRSSGLAVASRLSQKELLPKLAAIEVIPGGVSVSVKLPTSLAPAQFAAEIPKVASDLECISVQVSPGKNLNYVRLDLYWHDALAVAVSAPALQSLTSRDIQVAAPVGLFADGSAADIAIYERHTLVGGLPGSGKSVFVQLLLAWVALASNTRLYLLDAKGGVELGFWEQVALASGGSFAVSQEDGIATLSGLIDVMRERLAAMREAGVRKHVPTPEDPQLVLFIDELAAFTQGLDKKQAQEFNARLYTLTAQGRAAGISIIAATQKPTIETVGAARDLFHYRVAFSCPTPSMSDVILGEGQAASGADASSIPAGMGGVGFMLAEGNKTAKKFRAFYLSDYELEGLAATAATERLDRQFAQAPSDDPAEQVGLDD
jgi:S-DNA-T family DNA segregation ATPase FtsK/SpoIIIE